MATKFYTAKYDRVFKTIFCNEDNTVLLKGLLSRILKKNIEIIEFLRSELPVSSTVDKAKTVDLLVKADNEYLHTRNFIYFTNIYSKKVIRGEEYDYSTKFLHIDFTYGLSKNINDINYYYVMDENKNKYIDNFEMIEFNMDKIMNYWYNSDRKKVNEYKHLIMLDLDKNNLDKISIGDDFVKEYEKQVTALNNQETFQSFMSYEEDQRLIQNTEKKIAYEDGLEQDISQEKVEIAKNMLKDTNDYQLISKYTGLSVENIKKLEN